jgi:hypothetical protein
MNVFRQVAEKTLEGQGVYLTAVPHPHLPLQLYWFATAYRLAEHIGPSFVFWLKFPSILAEVAMIILIYSAIRRTRGVGNAILGIWVYAVNPVTTLVAAYQGQFDAIPLFLMMAAWYVFKFQLSERWALPLSSFLLGLGILSKSWPVILLPIVLLRLPNWRSRLGYMTVAVAVPIIGTLFYELLFPGSLASILRRSIHAGAAPGWWGYSAILNLMVEFTGRGSGIYAFFTEYGKIAALFCSVLVILLTRHRSAIYSLLVTILGLFATIPSYGVQYLSWVIPLAVVVGTLNEMGWYIASALVYMVTSYWGVNLTGWFYSLMSIESAHAIIKISSPMAWGVVVLWCAQELLRKQFLPCVFRGSLAQPDSSELDGALQGKGR